MNFILCSTPLTRQLRFFWAAGQLRPLRHHIYTRAQLSGSGAQLSGPGAQLSGPGAQLSAILVCIPTYVISAPLCMYRSLEAPSKTSDTIFWVAVMLWSAAFLFKELKKVARLLLNEVVRGMVMWFRTLAESVVGIKIDHGVTLEGPVLRATPGSVEGGSPWTGVGEGLRSVLRSVCQYLTMVGCPYPSFCCR